jgi:four helix bundle protein
MGDFRKLRAWQEAMDFAVAVYRATDEFPVSERFGLRSQVRRAASSVGANLAEGAGRGSPGAYHAFTRIARGSLHEAVSHLMLARQLGFLEDEVVGALIAHAERLGPMLSGILARKRPNG